jgi:hypothetical protein
MVLVTYYRLPHQTDETINRLCKQEIMELRNKHEKDIFVLAGDFSLPDINWSEQTISSNQYTVGFHRDILCRVGFGLMGLHAISSNTMS